MEEQRVFRFPRPGKALLFFLAALACLWLFFALGINWGKASAGPLRALVCTTDDVLSGELWRLLTAAVVHHPRSSGHVLFGLLVLYFFATPLEELWGPRRLFVFFAASAAFSYGCEALFGLLVPSMRGEWLGSGVLSNAATVAWALGASSQSRVMLYFVLPVRPMVIVAFLGVYALARVIAQEPVPEGIVSPFASMLAGWMLADQSPLRRAFLRRKLRRLEAQVAGIERRKARRRNGPNLRVLPGGKDDDGNGSPNGGRMLH
jgi:membrane associated rhomboid family serine protease